MNTRRKIFQVNPINEKDLYWIFKDLEKYQRTTFSFDDKKKHNSICRTIGRRGAHLVEAGLFVPPLSRKRKKTLTGVQLPKNVIIVENEKQKGIFRFLRRKP